MKTKRVQSNFSGGILLLLSVAFLWPLTTLAENTEPPAPEDIVLQLDATTISDLNQGDHV